MSAAPQHNLLVIADLHLTAVRDEEDAATDRELAQFLDHYRRQGDRPWRLVIAGDTFDFVYPDMQVFLDGYTGEDAPRRESGAFLQHWDVDAVAWRLRQTLRQRPLFCLALVDFIVAGNNVALVKGNHDLELQWARLQHTLISTLAQLSAERGRPVARRELDAAIQIYEWFYFEPGRVYVEHGNQYDEFNALPSVLDPALVHDPRRAFTPLGSRLTHYLTNAFPEYKPRPAPGAFQKHVKETGQLWSRKYIGRSLRVMGHAMANAGLFSEEGWRTGSGREDAALSAEARRWGLPNETMSRLHALQAIPATAVSGFFFNRMLLDRLLIVVICLAVLGTALGFGLFSWREPSLLALGVVGPLVLLSTLVLRFKVKKGPGWLKWLAPTALCSAVVAAPLVLDGGSLAGTVLCGLASLVASVSAAILPFTEAHDLRAHLVNRARAVARLLDVPLVIFGHHHLPVERQFAHGSRYVNVGAWVNSGVDQNHAHVVLVGDGPGQLRRGRDFWLSGLAEAETPGPEVRETVSCPQEPPKTATGGAPLQDIATQSLRPSGIARQPSSETATREPSRPRSAAPLQDLATRSLKPDGDADRRKGD